MENSIDGDTDCSEKCPTDRCLLLDKRDKQATTTTTTTTTINIPDDEDGDDGDDEDDDDEDKRIVGIINCSSRSIIVPEPIGECKQNGNCDNLTVNHHPIADNNLELYQQGNNQCNNLDQMNPSESHNHSENSLSDLVVKSKRFPRYNQQKKKSDNNVNDISMDTKGHELSSSPSRSFHPNGIVNLNNNNNNLIGNVQLHTLTINNNHFNCPNNLNNSGTCNGKSVTSSKCVRRLISSDSGGSNKSSSNKSGRKSRSNGPPQSPPDGGWGWVVVFASFMISLIADGVSLSYGFFQMDLSEHFGESKGKTALVGSLLLSMPALTGPIASALTDRYGCRTMTIVSGLLSAFGFILGSFARSLEHLFIAFSITGIGLSLSYVTSIVIVAYYFNTKRSFATGLAVCGTGIGTFLFAPLTTYLLKEYSWRGTLLIMSGFFLNIIVFGALMRDINVSEVDSIDGQESDSDSESVIETLGHSGCCTYQMNNLKMGSGGDGDGDGANLILNNGSQCSTIDVNNRNDLPLTPLTSNAGTFNCCTNNKLVNQLNTLTVKSTCDRSTKPLSSICINSHCSSSIYPHDEQLSNYEAHCKVPKLFHEPDNHHHHHHHQQQHHQCNHHQIYAHQQQCNHHPTNRRFQRFQSSYSSSKPKSDLRNYSSLVNIPTYITADSLVSKDVLDEISGRKDGNLNQLLQKYPDLLSNLINHDHDKSYFLSSGVIGSNDQKIKDHHQVQGRCQPISMNETSTSYTNRHNCNDLLTFNNHNKVNESIESRSRRFRDGGDPELGLNLHRNVTCGGGNRLKIGNNFIGGGNTIGGGGGGTLIGREGFGSKLQRASLTYRTAVFRDVRRYRLRSSSAPDIFTNSMVTIVERENFLLDIKQVIVDSVDLSIFKNIRFAIFCLSNLLLHGCIDVPYVYLPDHAISSGVCVKEMAFYLISVLGIANTLGTIIVGYIGDKTWLRPSTWYSGLTALGGISMALIPMARNYYLLAALSAFYGFSVSANYTLVSVILVEIISLDKFTNAYGLMLLVQGIASMLGPPIAGWLFDISGDYNTTFYVIGLCVLASGIIVFPLNESLSLASSSSTTASPSSSSSSSSNSSSMMESPSRTSSPMEDKIAALSSNKTLFDKDPLP